MKRIFSIIVLTAFLTAALMGCSSGEKETAKSEEELKAEIKAELEAETKKKAELKEEVKAELEAEQKPADSTKEKENPDTQEKKKAEEQPKAQETGKIAEQPAKSSETLIESVKDQGETVYYKYKANETVNFDIDGDGKKEEIKFDSKNGKLTVKGYEEHKLESFTLEKNYFIIVKFSDKFNTEMNIIGIIDYGISNDPETILFTIIEPRGEKSLCCIGDVPGVLVPESKYNADSMDDFNYKAVLLKGQGIEAPVRLSNILPQTWFGRNHFTYYSTYTSMIDNIRKYNRDYDTKVELKAEKDIIAHSEKDLNSEKVTIKAGQKVYLVHTDNEQWIAMATMEGAYGWVNVKEVTESHFSGYPLFD